MTPKWLLETDTFLEGNPQRMFNLLGELQIPAKWIKYVPFEGNTFDQFPPGDCVIVYGSLNLAAQIAKHKPWTPGLWNDPHALRCSTYYAHWGQHSIQQDYAMFPVGELRRLLPTLLSRFGVDDRVFIRPNENDKSFSGSLINESNFARWFDQNTRCYNLDPTSMAVVSRPQKILSEHRFIVADKVVITGSKYRIGDTLLDGLDAAGFDTPARDYAQQLISNSLWQPLRIYVLDIAQLQDRYALLEIGSINSCGLYGCELRPVLQHASRIALEDWEHFQSASHIMEESK